MKDSEWGRAPGSCAAVVAHHYWPRRKHEDATPRGPLGARQQGSLLLAGSFLLRSCPDLLDFLGRKMVRGVACPATPARWLARLPPPTPPSAATAPRPLYRRLGRIRPARRPTQLRDIGPPWDGSIGQADRLDCGGWRDRAEEWPLHATRLGT
jgi:hypothetical protein